MPAIAAAAPSPAPQAPAAAVGGTLATVNAQKAMVTTAAPRPMAGAANVRGLAQPNIASSSRLDLAPPPVTYDDFVRRTLSAQAQARALTVTESGRLSGSATQQFYRLQIATKLQAGSNEKTVLETFRVERNGERIRIVDADGSAYTGFIQKSDRAGLDQLASDGGPAPTDAAKKPGGDNLSDAKAATNTPATISFFFRVSGRSQTLNQPVVFSGTFTPGGTAAGGKDFALKTENGPVANAVSQPRVQGRVVINGVTEIDVDATATPSAK
jgi:hypothetical protein